MELSEIGKKIKKQEVKTIPVSQAKTPVVFGLPQTEQTPTLQGTMTTTPQTTKKPVAFKAPQAQPEQQPVAKPTEAEIIAKGGTITAPAPTKENPLRKVPLLGVALFGRGYNKTYESDTVAGQVEKGGLYGFVNEGFLWTTSPTEEQMADRIYERYDSLIAEGIQDERALDAAVQDTINRTAPNWRDINELKTAAEDPAITLTDEENSILFWNNQKEKLFTVLDAPIFVGSTKIAKEGVEELVERVSPIRDNMIKRLEEQAHVGAETSTGKRVKDVLAGDETTARTQEYVQFLKDTPDVSINQLNEGLELLRVSGKEYQDIADELVTVTQDLSRNPAKYIRDEKTGQFRGSVSDKAKDITPFTDEGEVTIRTISELEGRGSVSQQFIADSLRRPDIKEAERNIVNDVLSEYGPNDKINVQEFADKVKARLLPLQSESLASSKYGSGNKYESINLPNELRGDIADYNEFIYQSPIKNSAGQVHFNGQGADSYFAHTRIEDMADNSTRRVIEVQSDLFQKGRLEQQTVSPNNYGNTLEEAIARYKENFGVKDRDLLPQELKQVDEFMKDQAERTAYNESLNALQPYRNTWWERIIREEVKKAAQDGKTTLQFPTGETAMKIEGLAGNNKVWLDGNTQLKEEALEVGKEIDRYGGGFQGGVRNADEKWIITEVGKDGEFKAVPAGRVERLTQEELQSARDAGELIKTIGKTDGEMVDAYKRSLEEAFNVSSGVNTNNPIYKFYEKDVQKYLTKKYGAKVVTDANGVSWVQMAVNPQLADKPVEAFAGAVAGIEEDEEGNIQIDPTKAFLGMAAAGFLGLNLKKFKARSRNRSTAVQGDIAGRPSQTTLPAKTSQVGETGADSLASSHLSESLATDYAAKTGKSIVDSEKLLNPHTMKPRSVTPEQMGTYAKLRETLDNKWTDAMQWFQDDMVKVKNLVENPNVKVSDESDPYLAEILFHGRVGARVEEARDAFIAIDKDILTTAKKNGVPDQDMSVLVNDYLHSRHATERNARLGDGAAGITNSDATARLQAIDALPYADDVKRIAEQVQTMNNQTLDILLESQVIDQEAYDAMRTAYKNHVPLQRILDDSEDVVQALSGRGFDVKSTGIKRAKGSQREVADIMTNVVTNYEQAIIRAEKNLVDLTTLAFARENKELGLFEEIRPKAIGRGFDRPGELSDIAKAELSDRPMPQALESTASNLRTQIEDAWARIYNEFDYAQAGKRKSVVFEKDGVIDRIESTRSTFPDWVPDHLRSKDLFDKVVDLHAAGKVPRKNAKLQHELFTVMEEQMMKYLPLDAQDELALSYMARESETLASVYEKVQGAKGRLIYEQVTDPRVLTLRENGKPVFLKINNDDLAIALRGISREKVPSYMKGVQTFTRFYSGLQTRFNPEFAFPNKIRDIQESVVYAGSRGELGFTGGIKSSLDAKAYKDVFDHVLGRDTEGAKLYQQMIEDGGTTGGMSLSTREAVALDIAEIRTLNRSNPRGAAEKLVRSIDNFNTIFEDSTRLAIYKQALDRGVSRKRAAMLAKESTINFNKFGRGGQVINALWMFSNASIQGTTKMMRAMKNPKVAAAVSTSVFAGVYAAGEWNDTLDENWREKVPTWDRTNSLVLVLPSTTEEEFNYVTIPIGWGIKPIKVGADYLYDATSGKGATPEEAFSGIAAAAINAYNPVGGTDILSGITPTIADIPSEIYRNQAWHGGKIMPDWDERKDHLRYYSSLTDNTTGQMAVDISSGLSGLGIEVSPASLYYAYQGYIGGAGRFTTDMVNTMIDVGRGEMPEVNDIPVYSRFVKSRDAEEIGQGSDEYERVKDLKVQQDTERAMLSFAAEDTLKRLDSMDKNEAADLFDQIATKDPALAKKVNELMDDRENGLTYTQRNLKGLTVEYRANYIYDKLESLDSEDEKAELWDEYVQKKIITKDVADQIDAIYNGANGEDLRPGYETGDTTTQQSFISKMKLYADAIGTDPVTAFNRIFTGQKIRRIDGGAIIVERLPFKDSQQIRADWGATEEMRLDHTIPLQLGGSNDEGNLKLVPIEDWERYTAVENMLGKALREERIGSKKAQELIADYKSGKLTSQQVKDAIDNQ